MKNLEHLEKIIKDYDLEFDTENANLLSDFIDNNAALLYFYITPHFTDYKAVYDHATLTLAGSNDLYELDLDVTMEPDACEVPEHYDFDED